MKKPTSPNPKPEAYQIRTQVQRTTQKALQREQAKRLIDGNQRVSLIVIAGELLDEWAKSAK